MDKKSVKIEFYRWAGEFWPFKVKKRCSGCDLTYRMLHRMMRNEFRSKAVTLKIKPWLNNWWKIIHKGAWHAPIVLVNGRIFSQGVVPDKKELTQKVAGLLGKPQLGGEVKKSPSKIKFLPFDNHSKLKPVLKSD